MSHSPEPALDESLYGRIDAHLKLLRLPGALACYRELVRDLDVADAGLRLLAGLLDSEMESRELHRYERNLRAARFPVVKELGSFDFAAIPALPKPKFHTLSGL